MKFQLTMMAVAKNFPNSGLMSNWLTNIQSAPAAKR